MAAEEAARSSRSEVTHVQSRRRRGWLLAALGAVLLVSFCPLRAGLVFGRSMTPTLAPGSLLVFDQTYYRSHPVRSGDVVLIRKAGEVWVKRVYAAAGESFWTLRERLADGTFRRDPLVKGQEAQFVRFAAHERNRHHRDQQVLRFRIPTGMVFLIGDGAPSLDSRSVGPLAQADLLGRVMELPGQRLGSIPDYIELSFHKPVRDSKATSATFSTSSGPARKVQIQAAAPEDKPSAG